MSPECSANSNQRTLSFLANMRLMIAPCSIQGSLRASERLDQVFALLLDDIQTGFGDISARIRVDRSEASWIPVLSVDSASILDDQ